VNHRKNGAKPRENCWRAKNLCSMDGQSGQHCPFPRCTKISASLFFRRQGAGKMIQDDRGKRGQPGKPSRVGPGQFF